VGGSHIDGHCLAYEIRAWTYASFPFRLEPASGAEKLARGAVPNVSNERYAPRKEIENCQTSSHLLPESVVPSPSLDRFYITTIIRSDDVEH